MDTEIIYLRIPSNCKYIYNKMLYALADFGNEILMSCNKDYKTSASVIINCWNLFQSALAANEIGRTAEFEFFLDYISNQIDIVYRNNIIPIALNTKYTVFVGAHPSDIVDFDVNDKNYFVKYVKDGNINGTYSFDNKTYGNYGWICVPNEFKKLYAVSGGIFDIPLNNYIEATFVVDGKSSVYNCFRITDALVDGNHEIKINT